MAIFGSKKNTKKVAPASKATAVAVAEKGDKKTVATVESLHSVLIRPRITEKAANMTSENVYVFDISKRATKKDVMAAMKAFYKVTPRKVNVVNTKGAPVRLRTRRGFGKKPSMRKAYVFLNKGDHIQLG
ncbi:50S ribosomal protein L23 [Patescibacteria group bacterium]|nr:MAG: 50S ribosomal protein L23 [Patescibacteria group bacterium]